MKARKLLQKATSGGKNLRFDDLIKLSEAFGFALKRITGSHHTFKHPAVPALLSIQPDNSGQAKSYQVKQLLKLVEEYNLTIDDSGDEGEKA